MKKHLIILECLLGAVVLLIAGAYIALAYNHNQTDKLRYKELTSLENCINNAKDNTLPVFSEDATDYSNALTKYGIEVQTCNLENPLPSHAL
jgi:hypothetical protein